MSVLYYILLRVKNRPVLWKKRVVEVMHVVFGIIPVF